MSGYVQFKELKRRAQEKLKDQDSLEAQDFLWSLGFIKIDPQDKAFKKYFRQAIRTGSIWVQNARGGKVRIYHDPERAKFFRENHY